MKTAEDGAAKKAADEAALDAAKQKANANKQGKK
jgi:hypothetical protein